MHTEKPIFTAQFHPEAFGGPTDTEVNSDHPASFHESNIAHLELF